MEITLDDINDIKAWLNNGAYPDPSVYEQCFDVVQIDMNGKRIYMTRIGTGSDREFIYGTGAGLVT